jgi:hypothetical protein
MSSAAIRHLHCAMTAGSTPDSCIAANYGAANACDGEALGGAVSVSKIMKRPGRVCLRDWISAAFAAGKHVAALPRNEMNSFRRMRPPPQRTTPVA